MNARKIAIVASFVVATLALPACDAANGEDPSPPPSSSPVSSSAGPSPSATKTHEYQPASAAGPAKNVPIPEMPDLAKENTEEGAAAFTEYYFELINYTIETNDPEPIKMVTTRECEVCGESIIDEATEAKIVGKWQVGGQHHPAVVDSYISAKNRAIVTVQYTADASKFYVSPNVINAEIEELETTQVALGLEFDGDWKVNQILGEG